jgi:hypothetical protein
MLLLLVTVESVVPLLAAPKLAQLPKCRRAGVRNDLGAGKTDLVAEEDDASEDKGGGIINLRAYAI